MRNYLSFGGGVNSVALHLMLLDQGVDFESVFVHHGTDWPETYQYVAGFQWWLKANGHKPITVLRPNVQGFTSLFEFCIAKTRLPSIRQRWTTIDFKRRALNKYYPKGCFVMIGFASDESHRAKIQIDKDGREFRYPLIENEITRDGCKQIISEHGLPIPMKSGCFICPFQKRSQWVELRKNHPCLFNRVLELEDAKVRQRIDQGKKPFYINPSGKPLRSIVDENQTSMLAEDVYPPCQCEL